jgi:acyl-CoA reductase-like NAD-dependent aldehyde dehydrogenase
VVFDDADIECAVNGAAFACFVASGQTCVSGARLIVQSGIYDVFMSRFLDKVESIRRRMGDRKSSIHSLYDHMIQISSRYSHESRFYHGVNNIFNAS